MSDRPPSADGLSLVVSAPGVVELLALPRPEVGHGTVLIRPLRLGVCGTDLEIVDGTIDEAFVRYPLVLGHEWSGVVEEIGGGAAEGLEPGDLVVVEGIIPCGHCARCREGATNVCENYDEIGFTRDGAAGPFLLAPAHLVHRIDPEVGPDAAALVEPAAVVYRALRRVTIVPAARVLIIGAGSIALLAARLVTLWSPSSVTVLGRGEHQAELAIRAGATRYLGSPDGLGGDFDLVIEAAGAVDAVVTAVASARRGGTIVLLGYPGAGVTAPIPIDDVVNNDLAVIGSFSYTSAIWREVVGLLNAGLLSLDFLVTHRFSLAEWPQALAALIDTDGPRAKVMFELSR